MNMYTFEGIGRWNDNRAVQFFDDNLSPGVLHVEYSLLKRVSTRVKKLWPDMEMRIGNPPMEYTGIILINQNISIHIYIMTSTT